MIAEFPEHAGQFPADGLHQLEKYESHLHPKSAQLEALRVKMAELDKQRQKLIPDKELLAKETLIQELSAAFHMYQSWENNWQPFRHSCARRLRRQRQGWNSSIKRMKMSS